MAFAIVTSLRAELLPRNRTVTEATIRRFLVSKDEEISTTETQEP